ncbi:MAG: ABC transporter substrate-binding protein [Candidatus Dormibacteria bacterium]
MTWPCPVVNRLVDVDNDGVPPDNEPEIDRIIGVGSVMRRLVTLVVSAAVLALAGCGGSGSAPSDKGAAKGPILISGSYSKTGIYASSGTNVGNGYQLAVDEINTAGGVLGRQIKLELVDDTSDAATVVQLYTKFTTEEKVDALLSPYGSALGQAAVQLSERSKTPMVHSQTSSAAVFQNTVYNLQAGILPGTLVLAGAPALMKAQGYSTMALVNTDLDAYVGICDGVANAAKTAGVEVVTRQQYAKTTTDFTSVALKVKQANPDVVVECSAIKDTIAITRALPQQGFTPKLVVTAAGDDAVFTSSLGALANRALAYSAWSPKATAADSVKFRDSYQARFGIPAVGQAAGAYTSVKVLVAAMLKAGSTDKEKVNKSLHTDKFPTILGTYKVDSNGVQQGYTPLLIQYQDGVVQIVDPPKAATAKVQKP